MSDRERRERRERKEEHRERREIKTTGLLQNNQSVTLTAHIELVNLSTNAVDFRIQVLNWGTAVTQTNPVGSLLDVTQSIPSNSRIAFNAAVPTNTHYEVRLTVANNEGGNVLITTYGRTAISGGILEGYTVLDSQFQTVRIETLCL